MTLNGWLEIAAFAGLVALCVAPLGGYMARVFTGQRTFAHPVIEPIERSLYRLAGIDAQGEQTWLTYALCFLAFHALGVVTLYGLLRGQDLLPLNPQHFKAMAPDL